MTTAAAPSRERASGLLDPYRRITSTGQFIPEIDGLRFVAIFSVYIYHLAGDILRHSTPGSYQLWSGNALFATTQILNIGVPLFFVISGFILGMPFAAAHLKHTSPVPLKKYFLRRVTRLEPPYILCLLLFFALKIAGGRGTASELLPDLIASAFYAHNFVFGGPSAINIVAWSLEIEIQFYILAPVLALVFLISKSAVRRSALVALVLFTTCISRLVSGHVALEHSLLAYGQYFLAGFLLAEFYLSGGDKRQKKGYWDLVSLAGWVLFLALLARSGTVAQWAAPWLILLLYIAAFHSVAMNRFITNPWITTIGGMCYTIYLLHNYIIASLGMLTERILPEQAFVSRLVVQFLLMTPVVLVISGLYFRWIERPCMRPDWPRQLVGAFTDLKRNHLAAAAPSPTPRPQFDQNGNVGD